MFELEFSNENLKLIIYFILGVIFLYFYLKYIGGMNVKSFNGWTSIVEGFEGGNGEENGDGNGNENGNGNGNESKLSSQSRTPEMSATESSITRGGQSSPDSNKLKDAVIMIQKSSQDIKNTLLVGKNRKDYEDLLIAVDDNISLISLKYLILNGKQMINQLNRDAKSQKKLVDGDIGVMNSLYNFKNVIGDALRQMDSIKS